MIKEIIWLEDPTNYTYLRESTYITTSPKAFPVKTWEKQGRRIIGYECVRSEREDRGQGRRTYQRRFWFLKPHDRDLDPEGVYRFNHPVEAVIPASVQHGQESIPYRESASFREDVKRYEEDQQSKGARSSRNEIQNPFL